MRKPLSEALGYKGTYCKRGKEEETMGMIENDWLEELGEEFQKPYYKELYQFVKEE